MEVDHFIGITRYDKIYIQLQLRQSAFDLVQMVLFQVHTFKINQLEPISVLHLIYLTYMEVSDKGGELSIVDDSFFKTINISF